MKKKYKLHVIAIVRDENIHGFAGPHNHNSKTVATDVPVV